MFPPLQQLWSWQTASTSTNTNINNWDNVYVVLQQTVIAKVHLVHLMPTLRPTQLTRAVRLPKICYCVQSLLLSTLTIATAQNLTLNLPSYSNYNCVNCTKFSCQICNEATKTNLNCDVNKWQEYWHCHSTVHLKHIETHIHWWNTASISLCSVTNQQQQSINWQLKTQTTVQLLSNYQKA